jgi:hypothetical protein
MLILSTALVFGCATVLPPEYESVDKGRELSGPILALAGDGEVLLAANAEGIYLKAGDNPWTRLEAPGIKKFQKVTALAVRDGEICVGIDGEGLHILNNGTWEVRAARYGGLPDDRVFDIAFDGEGEGLSGKNLWVATGEGIAVRMGNDWRIYRPGGDWLRDIPEESSSDSQEVYVSPRFALGRRGEDLKHFRPPVTAIGIGPQHVVLGNSDSRLVIIEEKGLATIRLLEDYKVVVLQVGDDTIWVGTDGGLLWGGRAEVAKGTPWPAHRTDVAWKGVLFGSRDTRPFEYRWHHVGYNTARVSDLDLSSGSLWVAYQKTGDPGFGVDRSTDGSTGEDQTESITEVRRLVNINDYIARKQPPGYERYGKAGGIAGRPTAVLPLPERRELWIGTTKGLYRLER